MYSLTIHFGPNAMTWAFLFKEKERAADAYAKTMKLTDGADSTLRLEDDFGQMAHIAGHQFHGCLLEDLDLVERARIERSLAEERCKVKLMAAAKSDPVIGEAIRRQQGAPVLTPMGGFRQ
jgi:hypothetical protein